MNGQASKRVSVTVSEFFAAAKDRLHLDLISGKGGMGRPILEAAMNRPGLALTGFFQYFAHRRIQVFGHAENAYLASLSERESEKRIRQVFERHVPCVVVTRKRTVLPVIEQLSEEFGTPVLRTPLITMNFVNAATILMENLMAPRMTVQGTLMEIQAIGVLIEGRPGVGKSETALGLLRKGHSLVADDVTALRMDSSGRVFGTAPGVTRYHMEIRGLGIIHVPSLFGVGAVRGEKELDLIITLQAAGESGDAAALDEVPSTRDVMGVHVPVVVLPVVPGRDLANLVETAALDYKLKRLGHDAAKELDDKLKAVLAGGGTTRD